MEIEARYEFDADAKSVWALLRDFTAIERWWPKEGPILIDSVVVEGEGIGVVRHIYNRGMEKPVSERLDYLDSEDMTLILSIVGDRPKGIFAYVAVGKIRPLGNHRCEIDYKGFVSVAPGNESKVDKNIRFTWDRMFYGLNQSAVSKVKSGT